MIVSIFLIAFTGRVSEEKDFEIILPDGSAISPSMGTPQGGILSPLLANVVLNELDWWIASQWELYPWPTTSPQFEKNGVENRGNKYRAMRKTGLKRMHIVRYADDFVMFMQYHSNLAIDTFEADGRKAIYMLLQWVEDYGVLTLDEDMERCYAAFCAQVAEVEQTMLQRYAQRNSAGNQLRKLLNFIELRDENGNGGWDMLRNVIAEHMLDEQESQRKSNIVDMRMFGKMKSPKPE